MPDRDEPIIDQFMTAPVHTIGAEQTLAEASRRMREHGCRHLPVLVGGAVRGILSDRDIDLVAGLPGVDASAIAVEEAMVPDPYAVAPGTPLVEVLDEMARHKYGTALVVKNKHAVGIFTAVDAIAAFRDHLAAHSAA
ncbi:MAG: CBS domain-containing protein [Nannocystaceae bacterium]